MSSKFKNGIIYSCVDFFVKILKYLNLVEYFKRLFNYLFKSKTIKLENYNIAIDIYILLKWIFLLIVLIFLLQHILVTFLILYLLFMNLFTYFYYHFWDERAVYKKTEVNRIKRRFISLIQSILFTIVSFSYLYYVPFNNSFNWGDATTSKFLNVLNFSFSNTFIANTAVYALDNVGLFLQLVQYCISFIFLAIILAHTFNYKLEVD